MNLLHYLSYAMVVRVNFYNKVLNKFNVCWNNMYRIVFGMHMGVC